MSYGGLADWRRPVLHFRKDNILTIYTFLTIVVVVLALPFLINVAIDFCGAWAWAWRELVERIRGGR